MPPEDTAPAAQPTDDAPAAPVFSNPNDLETELSEAEEMAFVDQTLGLPSKEASHDKSVPTDKPDDTPPADAATPEPVLDEKPEPVKQEEPAPAVSDPKPEVKSAPELDENGIQTDDLWVEVQGSDGNSVKLVYDPSNPASFIPPDFTFKDDKQMFDILDARVEMGNIYKERNTTFESQRSEADAIKTSQQAQADKLASWDAEIDTLMESGVMETPKMKPGEKGWLEDKTVQTIDATFKYMTEQNELRAKEGKAPIQSFGTAYNMYNHDAQVQAEAEAEAEKVKTVKARGAVVGGTSSTSAGASDNLYKRGSASNIYQVQIDD